MIENSWDDCLPESHREAPHNALCLLVDDFRNDPDYDAPLCVNRRNSWLGVHGFRA